MQIRSIHCKDAIAMKEQLLIRRWTEVLENSGCSSKSNFFRKMFSGLAVGSCIA
jgi:hypothetical protein